MESDQTWVLHTSQLSIGMTLSFDLTDRQGRVILKTGERYSDSVRQRLIDLGIDSVTLKVRPAPPLVAEPAIVAEATGLLDSYEPESVARLQARLASTQAALSEFIDEVRQEQSVPADSIRSELDRFFAEAAKDTSTALGVIAANAKPELSNADERLLLRSTQLSWFSMVTGIAMGLNAAETVGMGLAGALHDVALILHPEWLDPEYRAREFRKFSSEYQRHPILSAERLSNIPGVNDRVLMNVMQVHEQADGSGYPRGLRATQILPSARILNTVDAYLEIVDPLFRSPGIFPADALAQLCLHGSRGVFDRDAVQALVRTLSLYPIGTMVELNDSTQAVVVRSNPADPLKPIVRLLNDDRSMADLSQGTNAIRAPIEPQGESRQRITKLGLAAPLWDGSVRNDSR